MAKSPTARTLEALGNVGCVYEVTEHRDAHTRNRTHDLFGFIDILALDPMNTGSILGIQATDKTSFSKRKKKITGECRDKALAWLRCGGRIQVWGWAPMKPEPRVEEIVAADFREENNAVG